jgi:hypothetical protein
MHDDSYARHWAQKEDRWSVNAVGAYWYVKLSMIWASSQIPHTLPPAASIAGVSRMPSFVRIASAVRREREVSHAGAGLSRVRIDPMSGRCDCECSSHKKRMMEEPPQLMPAKLSSGLRVVCRIVK